MVRPTAYTAGKCVYIANKNNFMKKILNENFIWSSHFYFISLQKQILKNIRYGND